MTRTVNIDLTTRIPLSLFEDPLAAAILISLFSDSRADDASLPDPRGWWGDQLGRFDGDRIGSLLWRTQTGKHTAETLRRVEDAARAALAWMAEDGLAERIDVSASSPRREWLLLSITLDSQRIDLEIAQ